MSILSKKRETTILFQIYWLLLIMWMATKPAPTLNSYVGRAMFGFEIVYMLMLMYFMLKDSFLKLGMIVLLIFNIYISHSLNETTPIDPSMMHKVVNFVAFITLLQGEGYVILDKTMLKRIFALNIILSIVFIMLSQSSVAYYMGKEYLEDNYLKTYDYLTLGMSNPNEAAIMLLSNLAILTLSAKIYKHGWIVYVLSAIILYLIYLTGSRTAVAIGMAVILITLFAYKINLNLKLVILLCVFLIPFVYLFVLMDAYDKKMFMDLEIFGKSIYTGREQMYREILEEIDTVLERIVGNVRKYPFNNAHNGPLSIYSASGVFGVILYYSFLIKKLFNDADSVESKTSKIMLLILCLLYIDTISEAALAIGGTTFTIIIMTLYILARSPIDIEYKKTRKEGTKWI